MPAEQAGVIPEAVRPAGRGEGLEPQLPRRDPKAGRGQQCRAADNRKERAVIGSRDLERGVRNTAAGVAILVVIVALAGCDRSDGEDEKNREGRQQDGQTAHGQESCVHRFSVS
jgi:hypothetical protein